MQNPTTPTDADRLQALLEESNEQRDLARIDAKEQQQIRMQVDAESNAIKRENVELQRRLNVILRAAIGLCLLLFAAGCTDAPTAPTPATVGSLVAGAPAGNGETAESAASGELLRVRIPPPATNLAPPTLTLTVTPDGARDRVRASIGGIVGVSFYPGAGKRRCRPTR